MSRSSSYHFALLIVLGESFLSYQSLATKYRPRRFQDMVGQDAVTIALSNAIRLGRIPQGVIFSGVRGIGKTTTARLYAKALNCEQGPTSDPCNQCDSCLAINAGNHEDVMEIDGASNTSVDDVRALQETLDYVPQRSPYKIYIIDEVHMLSQSAFNALLKTLEEPPKHVVFTFATTELQKVPETVLSRCQTFHLKRLTQATIVARLAEILKQEDVGFEEHALASIAKEGRGSMRDSLTFLDQVIALGDGQVSSDSLKGLINTASSKSYIQFLTALVKKDAAVLMAVIETWDQRGISLGDATEEVARFSRHGFVLKELGEEALDLSLLGLAPTELESLAEAASLADNLDLNRIFRTLVKCRKDLDGSELDRFILENYALEWCLDPGMPSIDDLKNLVAGTGGVLKAPEKSSAPTPPVDVKQERSPSGKSLKQRWATAFSGESPEVSTSPAEEKVVEKAAAPKPVSAPPAVENKEVRRLDPAAVRQSSHRAPVQEAALVAPAPVQEAAPVAPAPVQEAAPVAPVQEAAPMQKSANSTMVDGKVFPDSWRSLVEVWKRQKPLQGRILEETVPLEYSSELIKVAVDPTSMAGAKLLHAEHKKRVLDGIRELFSFKGQLVVLEREGKEEPSPVEPSLPVEPSKESLLETRQKEEEQARQDLFAELKDHPITKEALSVFDGKISNIGMSDI